MRLPGSNLPLPNIIAWSILLAGGSFAAVFFGVYLLMFGPSRMGYSPLFLIPVAPYAVAVGLVIRRAWKTSASLPKLVRFLLSVPPVFVLSWWVAFNLTAFPHPEGFIDDSPFASPETYVPQTSWGWPAPSLRVYDETLEDWGDWLFDGSSTAINIWLISSTLLGLIFCEAVAVAGWRFLRHRLKASAEEKSGLA